MRLVPEPSRLDPPGICFICEGQPQREVGESVIDTEFVFNPAGPSNLRGRKYVCEGCAMELSNLVR